MKKLRLILFFATLACILSVYGEVAQIMRYVGDPAKFDSAVKHFNLTPQEVEQLRTGTVQKVLSSSSPAKVQQREEQQTVKVTYHIKYDPERQRLLFQQYMFPVTGEFPAYSFPDDDGTAEFEVVPGVYDLVAIVEDEFSGIYLIARDNVEINEDATYDFDISEAVNHIEYSPLMPDGKEMSFSSYDPITDEKILEGTIEVATLSTYLSNIHYGQFFMFNLLTMSNGELEGEIISGMRLADIHVNDTQAFSSSEAVFAFSLSEENPLIAILEAEKSVPQTVHNDVADYVTYNSSFANALLSNIGEEIEIVRDAGFPATMSYNKEKNLASYSFGYCSPLRNYDEYDVCLPIVDQNTSIYYEWLPMQYMASVQWNPYGITGVPVKQSKDNVIFNANKLNSSILQ